MIEKPLDPIVQADIKSINEPRTLLQRYNINIDHLDFDYIKTTKNVRELEKMVLILRSGQEGYFPDLTKCAEDRLQVLNPGSKILRSEQTIKTFGCMDTDEEKSITNEIQKWENEIKSYDNRLRKDNSDSTDQINYPPIRQNKCAGELDKKKTCNAMKRIPAACDYDKWDKYDADAEITKMDLHEERNRELHNMKINREQNKLIEELEPDEKLPAQLSDVEKLVHANRFKDRGNECFRAKDYKQAVSEYTLSINMTPTAAAYNNRAMAYLKINFTKKALIDCDECLNLEPLNIKAHLRKAQALLNDGRRRDAFVTYEAVLSLDPENTTAQKYVNDLKKELPDLVKSQKFRLKIDEDDVPPPLIDQTVRSDVTPPLAVDNSKPSQAIEDEPVKDIDFAKLIIPNKIVKNRLPDAIKALGNLKSDSNKKMHDEAKKRVEHLNRPITILPQNNNKNSKPLIQEI